MTDYSQIDFFTDPSLVEDPFDYFDYLRSQCPVHREPYQGVLAVTGYDEAVAVHRDTDAFSACNVLGGPFPGLPVEPEGDDITDLIAEYRDVFPLSENFASFDPPEHTRHRRLLQRLITPRRLSENEEFMWRFGEQLVDEFAAKGHGDFVKEVAEPFALLVIADFLGVPEADHEWFKEGFQQQKKVGSFDGDTYDGGHLSFLEDAFTTYVEDRRREPRDDALTKLTTARFADDTLPDVIDVVRIAGLLFAAGKGTTVHLLGMAMAYLADDAAMQERLRADREGLHDFVEEALRIDSPNKAIFRLARKSTSVGGVDVPAGSTAMIMTAAANRDPQHFDDPAEFRTDRPNVMDHIAFGRGAHACPGAPLVRAEGRVLFNLILDRMGDIVLSDAHHGARGDRHFRFPETFFMRVIEELHVEFTPIRP